MSIPSHPVEPAPEDVGAGHELSDAQAWPILRFLAFLVVASIATAAAVAVFYNYLEGREAREKTARYPLAVGQARPLPPPPRLQTYPFTDLKDLRREEEQILDHYQWVDKNAGVVRIPVERAIELTAERGLPVRGATPAKPSAEGSQPPAAQGSQPPATEKKP
jgi:hypothetical protein